METWAIFWIKNSEETTDKSTDRRVKRHYQDGDNMIQQLELAIKYRDAGIAAISARNQTFLETVRGAARMICRRHGTVTADDVRKWADENGIEPTGKNAWGAVFKSRDFVAVGFTTSRQVQGHGNLQRVWALREPA
jgi:hypothetical protein